MLKHHVNCWNSLRAWTPHRRPEGHTRRLEKFQDWPISSQVARTAEGSTIIPVAGVGSSEPKCVGSSFALDQDMIWSALKGVASLVKMCNTIAMKISNFLAKVNQAGPNGCWLWTGRTLPKGYGQLGRHDYAHRVSYELHKGPIPEGKRVCHSCDTPRCVNPEHLWLGTQAENLQDMAMKGRSTRGASNPQAKLTEQHVHEMWDMHMIGARQKEIAAKFGVHAQYVSLIFSGRRWRHIFNQKMSTGVASHA